MSSYINNKVITMLQIKYTPDDCNFILYFFSFIQGYTTLSQIIITIEKNKQGERDIKISSLPVDFFSNNNKKYIYVGVTMHTRNMRSIYSSMILIV